MKEKNRFLLAGCFFLLSSLSAHAAVRKGQIGFGVNTPGIHARYFFTNRLGAELKFQFERDISITGLRGLWYFQSETKLPLFVGLEGDLISFKTTQLSEKKKGTGSAGSMFVGGEYFFTNRSSFQMDVGPAYIHLSEKFGDDTFTAEGWDIVANFALNFYFRQR